MDPLVFPRGVEPLWGTPGSAASKGGLLHGNPPSQLLGAEAGYQPQTSLGPPTRVL